jgi:hypothetical protein
MGRETLDNGRSSRRWGGPDEEDGTHTLQPSVERFGHREVAGDDLDVVSGRCTERIMASSRAPA